MIGISGYLLEPRLVALNKSVHLKLLVDFFGEISSKRCSQEKKLNLCHQMLIPKSPIKFDFVIPPLEAPENL